MSVCVWNCMCVFNLKMRLWFFTWEFSIWTQSISNKINSEPKTPGGVTHSGIISPRLVFCLFGATTEMWKILSKSFKWNQNVQHSQHGCNKSHVYKIRQKMVTRVELFCYFITLFYYFDFILESQTERCWSLRYDHSQKELMVSAIMWSSKTAPDHQATAVLPHMKTQQQTWITLGVILVGWPLLKVFHCSILVNNVSLRPEAFMAS